MDDLRHRRDVHDIVTMLKHKDIRLPGGSSMPATSNGRDGRESYPEPVVVPYSKAVRVLVGLVCAAFCVGFFVAAAYGALHLWDYMGWIERGELTTVTKYAFGGMITFLVSTLLLVILDWLARDPGTYDGFWPKR
jgi:hypothetical protein